MATKKKVTVVTTDESKTDAAIASQAASAGSVNATTGKFQVSEESKKKATSFRIFSILAWVVAFAMEVLAILVLRKQPATLPFGMSWFTALIVLIVIDLAFAICGSLLWKKANRCDPASKQDKFRFFVQNQLGAILTVVAFLPLVLLILTDKNINGRQKAILGVVAAGAMLLSGVFGVDYNPPSIEEYAEQTAEVQNLTGVDHVYWTKSGTKYHIYDDCQHINTAATTEIFQGTVAQARELKNITELCKTCAGRAEEDPQYANLNAA